VKRLKARIQKKKEHSPYGWGLRSGKKAASSQPDRNALVPRTGKNAGVLFTGKKGPVKTSWEGTSRQREILTDVSQDTA